MMETLVFLLALVAIALAAWYAYHIKQKRREALAVFAFQHGLEFAREDPFGLVVGHPFRLFSLGDGRGCENVMWGTWQGLPVKGADYWYYTQRTDSKGRTHRSYSRFSIVVADLEAVLPHVTADRESLFTRLSDHLGFRDIEFESEQFNRRFQVKSVDRQFAYRLIDARMMRWLLGGEERFGFEVLGDKLLAHCGRRKPTELIPLLGTAMAFRDHIPRLVWAEYGRDAPGPPDRERSMS